MITTGKRTTGKRAPTEEKIQKRERIFFQSKDDPIQWKDIKHLDLQDDDIIYACYEEAFYSENESWEAHFYCEIIRTRLETDEEYKERMEEVKVQREELRQKRYARYLELKKEFES